MIARIFIAIVGAVIVTGGLLLAMEGLTSLFEKDAGERYFRITDILDRPAPGRPERPRAGSLAPDQPAVEVATPSGLVPIEAPADVASETLSVPAPEIPSTDLPRD